METKIVIPTTDKKNRWTPPLQSFTAISAFNSGTNQHKIILKKLNERKKEKEKVPRMDHSILTYGKFTSWRRWDLIEHKEKNREREFTRHHIVFRKKAKNAAGQTWRFSHASQPSSVDNINVWCFRLKAMLVYWYVFLWGWNRLSAWRRMLSHWRKEQWSSTKAAESTRMSPFLPSFSIFFLIPPHPFFSFLLNFLDIYIFLYGFVVILMIIRERGFSIRLSVLWWMGRKFEQWTMGFWISRIVGEIIQGIT